MVLDVVGWKPHYATPPGTPVDLNWAPAAGDIVDAETGELIGFPTLISRVAEEPHFLDKLGLYDPQLPFIGVPIRVGEEGVVGVFAAQPPALDDLLRQRVRFLEMVANLIGQAVRLAHTVEDERRELREERDKLRRQVRGNHGFDSVIGHTDAMRVVFDQVR